MVVPRIPVFLSGNSGRYQNPVLPISGTKFPE
jgi:hypothetical protein